MYGSQFHKPIVVVGSINADLVCQTERIPLSGETLLGSNFRIFPGGKGANQAVAVARLGCPVHMIGKLGDDAFAGLLRLSLTDAGVNVAGVDTVSEASGVAFIEVAASGANSIVVVPGANVRLLPADLDRHVELLRAAGAVLAQLEIPIGTVDYLAQICRREQIPLILDPAPACALPAQLLRDLRQAVVELDTARTQALIQQVTERDASLGRALNTLATQLGYKRLLKLLKKGQNL